MGKITDPLTGRPAPLTIRESFRRFRASWALSNIHNGEKTLEEVLEHYDPNAEDGDASNPILGPKTKVRVRVLLTGRRKVIAWICLLCWMVFVYLVTFYSLTFLEDKTTTVFETIKFTADKIHGSVADTYEGITHPNNPQEVADLMGEFYELLARMGYFDPSIIAYPPHTEYRINKTFAETLGYSQKAIEMMEMLPYLGRGNETEGLCTWQHGGGDNEFFLSGTFVDYRQDGYLEEKDPLYALDFNLVDDGQVRDFDEPGGPYMKPDYILLMTLGNHGAIMVLNTNNYKLWTIDQEMGSSADFALENVVVQQVNNDLSLDNYPSRTARLALRDYMQKFIDLEWMPGGMSNGSWDGANYARLYVENGWPDNFNRSAFLAAIPPWEEEEAQRSDAEKPFQDLENCQRRVTNTLRQIENKHKLISEIDSGKEIEPGRETDRQAVVDEINKITATLPNMQAELEVAREALNRVDPGVRKAREDRISKYGY